MKSFQLLLHSKCLGFTYIQTVEPYKQVSITTKEHSKYLHYICPYAGYLKWPHFRDLAHLVENPACLWWAPGSHEIFWKRRQKYTKLSTIVSSYFKLIYTCYYLLYMLIVWSIYFPIWANSANYFGQFTTHWNI